MSEHCCVCSSVVCAHLPPESYCNMHSQGSAGTGYHSFQPYEQPVRTILPPINSIGFKPEPTTKPREYWRYHFAGLAMSSYLSSLTRLPIEDLNTLIKDDPADFYVAKISVRYADALLEELDRKK